MTAIPFYAHIKELQGRLLQCALVLVIASAVAYNFRVELIDLIIKPFGQPLFYTKPSGGFEIAINVSILAGFLFTLPFALYHLAKFLEPALPNKVTYSISHYLFASILLSLAAIGFAYFVIIPSTFRFLNEFGTDQVRPLVSAASYLAFVMTYLFFTVLIFQLPLVMLILDKLIKFKVRKMLNYLSHVVIASFIIAAIITPSSDPINQTLMALPLVCLYLVSIGCIFFTRQRDRRLPRPNLMV